MWKRSLAASEVVLTRTYHTKANSQSMMETFRTFCYLDEYSRLCVVSSTQVPFHVRRILSNALEMKKADIRVIKPRIGGGFGCQAELGERSVPGFCHPHDRQTGLSGIHPAGESDQRFAPA